MEQTRFYAVYHLSLYISLTLYATIGDHIYPDFLISCRYLIHTPYHKGADGDLQAAWAAMENVKTSGKARSIGVSNFESTHLEEILREPSSSKTRTPPSINQVEFHPYLQQQDLRTFSGSCVDGRGIAVAGYGATHPITRNPSPGSRLDETLKRIAAKHGVSVGLLCLRLCIDQDRREDAGVYGGL